MKISCIVLIILFFPMQIFAATPKPFTSDGCSSSPNGTPGQKQLWLNCCIAHDFAYWQGGTCEQRKEADIALRSCVSAVGEPEIAALMLAGVRVGGTPYLPTNFRWGYGWPYPRLYGELSDAEKREIKKVLQENHTPALQQLKPRLFMP